MAIHLSCPVCGTNRFKAPIQAKGKRCHCPECRSTFRLTDGMPVLKWGIAPKRPTAPELPVPAESKAETRPASIPTEKTRIEAAQAPVVRTPASVVSVTVIHEPPARSRWVPRDPGDQFALAAAGLTGFGLILTSVPYGRGGTVLFAGAGLLAGLCGLLAAERRRRWSAVAASASSIILAVICLAPGWLGLRPWWDTPPTDQIPDGQIQAFSRAGTGASAAGEWVDASQSVWRQDDVEVVVNASVGPVELVSPKGQKKWSRERYLQITLKVGNKGAERRLAVSAWPLADGSTLQASADGVALVTPKYESSWSPVLGANAAGVYPGKSHTQVFFFVVPASGDVQLTIPAAGIGSRDAAKIVIPRAQYAPSPAGRPRR